MAEGAREAGAAPRCPRGGEHAHPPFSARWRKGAREAGAAPACPVVEGGRQWREAAEGGSTPMEIGAGGGRWRRKGTVVPYVRAGWGLVCWGNRNWVWWENFVVPTNLGSIVEALLEFDF